MRVYLMGLALSTAIYCTSTQAQAQNAATAPVQWYVANRYRLFAEADAPARRRVEDLLRTMNVAAAAGNPGLVAFYGDLLALLSGPQAETLRRSNFTPSSGGTSGRYRNGNDGSYLYPAYYTIRVSAPAAGSAMCRWRLGGRSPPAAACTAEVPLEVAANEDGNGGRAELYLSIDGAPERAPIPIDIRDELIVAMGDSYISGEGNPDIPVHFDLPEHESSNRFAREDWPARLRPGEYLAARWWDQPCHRSLLSWPVLASFARAARMPQSAVTLVHLGCSGDEVEDGLLHFRWQLPGGGRETQSQMEMLAALRDRPNSPPRRVDILLLSIGGNDVGFSYVVAGLILPPNGWRLWGIAARTAGDEAQTACAYQGENRPLERFCGGRELDGDVPIDRRSAELRLGELPARMAKFADVLHTAGIARERVFQIAYPNPLIDSSGAICRSALSENDLRNLQRRQWWTWPGSAIEARRRAELASETDYRDTHRDGNFGFEALLGVIPEGRRGGRPWRFQMRYDPEREVGDRLLDGVDCDNDPEPDDSETCQGLWVWSNLNRRVRQWTRAAGWGLIDRHQDVIEGHGWCNSVRQGALSLRFPVAERGPDGLLHWRNGHPNAFDAYARPNTRWFRTTNDSALTQFEHPGMFHKGTIHPTFNAHVAMAEAALAQAFAAGP